MGGYVTTNLRLPEDLHKLLKHMAVEENTSVSQLVREALEQFISPRPEQPKSKKLRIEDNPLWALVGSGRSGLKDASEKHDEYLYGKRK